MKFILFILVILIVGFGFSTTFFLNAQEKNPALTLSPTQKLSSFIGTYEMEDSVNQKLKITLVISSNMKVLLSTDLLNGTPPIVESGNATFIANNLLSVNITAEGKKVYDTPFKFTVKKIGDTIEITKSEKKSLTGISLKKIN